MSRTRSLHSDRHAGRRNRSLRPSIRLAGAGLIGALALTACGGGDNDDDGVELRFAWWGSDHRADLTYEVIEAFEAEHPDITIAGEYSDWQGYWDQLATQTAAQDAPDVFQMDDMYLREYADRGTLLDLTEVDVSDFDEAIVDAGTTEDGLVGVTVGTNTWTVVANPDLFEEAGVELPDDTTWTWEDFHEISVELSDNLEGAYGSTTGGGIASLQAWLRQNGSQLVTEDGELGFDAAEAEEFFQYNLDMVQEGGTPDPAHLAETWDAGPEESLIGTNEAALHMRWSNEMPSLENASGAELQPLRLPSQSGSAEDNGSWYKPSQLLSVFAGTDHPEEAQLFIDFFVNSEEAAEILQTERGLTPNTDLQETVLDSLDGADLRASEFLVDIGDEVGEAEPVPPAGYGAIQDILGRYEQEVYFERQTPAEAAENFIQEAEDALN
ncbi:ABC transporter substrate-binding protein [Nesterenkonia alba]|uniref:ABC transporter substrate-binding protein n=1 Tax=Nesterenkonia alba TaxID=515814 RepID=UPI0003B30478|nr:sugar ABC transporter substrate-binding protein [Nesterenkonia alba]